MLVRLLLPIALISVGAAAAVSGGPVGLATASAPARLPSVQIVRATVDRGAHTVDLRLRICFSAGPRARIAIAERRTFHGRVATHRWAPRAEEPIQISPFTCRTGWRLNWLLEQRLQGPGTYSATLRVRDAFGRWAPAVAFSLASA